MHILRSIIKHNEHCLMIKTEQLHCMLNIMQLIITHQLNSVNIISVKSQLVLHCHSHCQQLLSLKCSHSCDSENKKAPYIGHQRFVASQWHQQHLKISVPWLCCTDINITSSTLLGWKHSWLNESSTHWKHQLNSSGCRLARYTTNDQYMCSLLIIFSVISKKRAPGFNAENSGQSSHPQNAYPYNVYPSPHNAHKQVFNPHSNPLCLVSTCIYHC